MNKLYLAISEELVPIVTNDIDFGSFGYIRTTESKKEHSFTVTGYKPPKYDLLFEYETHINNPFFVVAQVDYHYQYIVSQPFATVNECYGLMAQLLSYNSLNNKMGQFSKTPIKERRNLIKIIIPSIKEKMHQDCNVEFNQLVETFIIGPQIPYGRI